MKSLKILVVIAILLLLIGIAQAEDWPMFHHDLMRTGCTNESVKPPLALLWKYNFSDSEEIYSSPVIADGILYVSPTNWNGPNYIYALDGRTGKLKWKSKIEHAFFSASPTVSDGIVYVGDNHGYLYALDARNGDLKWKYDTTGSVGSSPAVAGEIVYFCTDYDHIYALDAKTGELKWKYRCDRTESSPAVSDGFVYAGVNIGRGTKVSQYEYEEYDGYILALDAKTGELKWKYDMGNTFFSSPAVLDGMIYIGSEDNHVYALDAKTGDLKWKYKTDDPVCSSPAVGEGIIYICSGEGHVYALDAKTGELKWKYETGENHYDRCTKFSPVVSDGIVYTRTYFYGDDFYFSALDAKTGELKWKYKTGYIEHSPAISGGIVYVCSIYGDIYAFANESAVLAASAARTAKIVGLSIFGFIVLILGIIGVFKVRRSAYEKRIKPYRDRYEQLKAEGYAPDEELEEMLK